MLKSNNLVITGLPTEWTTLFKDLCDALELSRDQLLILLMIQNGTTVEQVDGAIAKFQAQTEWRELVMSRLFMFVSR